MVDVDKIRYSQNTASDKFRNGSSIYTLIDELKDGKKSTTEVPAIEVAFYHGTYISKNNRRLFCFKTAGIKSVGVRIVPLSAISDGQLSAGHLGDVAGQVIIIVSREENSKHVQGARNSSRKETQAIKHIYLGAIEDGEESEKQTAGEETEEMKKQDPPVVVPADFPRTSPRNSETGAIEPDQIYDDECEMKSREQSTLKENLEKAPYDPHEHFICPISLDIMKDPVVASDGQTYERVEIQMWLEKSSISPKTGLELPSKVLYPNVMAKALIGDWRRSLGTFVNM